VKIRPAPTPPPSPKSLLTRFNERDNMANTCIILRGLSGTGKSELAENLRDTLHPTWKRAGAIFSTDDLFMVDGEYQFDPTKLGEYHAKNLENATDFMRRHHTAEKAICIIDNTNTQHWEYEKYVEAAKANDFIVQVISIAWKQEDIPLYAERNSHGVPEEAIQRMADRWEY